MSLPLANLGHKTLPPPGKNRRGARKTMTSTRVMKSMFDYLLVVAFTYWTLHCWIFRCHKTLKLNWSQNNWEAKMKTIFVNVGKILSFQWAAMYFRALNACYDIKKTFIKTKNHCFSKNGRKIFKIVITATILSPFSSSNFDFTVLWHQNMS